jgi:hypothetical protein
VAFRLGQLELGLTMSSADGGEAGRLQRAAAAQRSRLTALLQAGTPGW